VGPGGVQAVFGGTSPAISADGRFVAFDSNSGDLVPGDTNNWADVFVHDRQTGTTTRVSVGVSAGQENGPSDAPAISADGRFVAFVSQAGNLVPKPAISADGRMVAFQSSAFNLVPGDTNGSMDVFVHDRQTATTTRVSVGSGGAESNTFSSSQYTLSADGRMVAFVSSAHDLTPGDTNGVDDMFVHEPADDHDSASESWARRCTG
jgi:Tol biopolymer transport system component